MAINVRMLGKSMIDAARSAVGPQWNDVGPIAEMQLRTLAQAAGEIDDLLRSGKITEERARELFAMYRTAAQEALRGTSQKASSIADVLTKAAVGAIKGQLGTILGGTVTAMFKAGKDL